jgi:hypothetical protein
VGVDPGYVLFSPYCFLRNMFCDSFCDGFLKELPKIFCGFIFYIFVFKVSCQILFDVLISWALYKAMKDLVKKTMNEAHENYIRNILNIEDNCETSTKQSLGKKFWKYIKSRKKDNMGISPLKNESGEEVIGWIKLF